MDVKKTILITGAEVADVARGNRGAAQLLATSSSRARLNGYSSAVAIGKVDRTLRQALDLTSYIGNPRTRALDRFTPRVDALGYTSIQSLAGVLDASGYALGDPWGVHTATWISRKFDQWNRVGIPIVALPQAFGPFEEPDVADAARAALENCRLIYAREPTSYQHVIDLGINPEKCRIAPDITLGERASGSGGTGERHNRLVIVPNWNLKERVGGDDYVESLREVCGWADRSGMEVVGLLHEGTKDLQILNELTDVLTGPIYSDLTGWETKKFIGKSRAVIAGRYHAVAACLATQTPVVVHSWSHKYRELLALYDNAENMADPVDPSETITVLQSVMNRESNRVSTNSAQLEIDRSLELMWAEVFDALEDGRANRQSNSRRGRAS